MAYQTFNDIMKADYPADIDEIVEVDKSIDEITEVEKFNPFHDNLGRFSSSNGFASYSANPNTKAGAMAIARSVAAGHGGTKNVHAQSSKQDLNADANQMKQGNGGRMSGKRILQGKVEPLRGLAGASAVGAQWQTANAASGKTIKPTAAKPAVQKPKPTTTQQQNAQKPADTATQQQTAQQAAASQSQGSLAADVSGVNLASSDKLAIQLRNKIGYTQTGTKTANDNYQERVAGKDISKSFDVSKATVNRNIGEGAIDAVAEAQGWRKSPTVTNDLETFQKAAVQSGQILVRSVGAYTSGDGKRYSDVDACKEVMTNGKASLNGSGHQFYGGGLYMVGAKISSGSSRNTKTIAGAQNESFGYNRQQMMATVQRGTKIADFSTTKRLDRQFGGLSSATKAKFGNDVGAYIASKGYDGACWHNNSNPYITMYNKSAMIFYGSTAHK